MDAGAKEDAESIVELLTDSGIRAILLDDDAPGVPEGVFEVQVPAPDAARAEKLIDESALPEEGEDVDDSPALDPETIFHAEASPTAEIEALGIKSLLDANGIAAVMVGDSVLPNLAFQVRVARDQADRARQLIAEAQKIGPAAAAQAELESEGKFGSESGS